MTSASQYGDTANAHYCDRNAAATAYIVISSFLFACATVLLALRIYVRSLIVYAFWWDDVLLLISYAITTPFLALFWSTVGLGLGRHTGCVSNTDSTKGLEYYYIGEVLVIFSNIFARAAAALLVLRLFAITKRLKYALYGWTIFMAMAIFTCAFLVLFECRPIQAEWDSSLRPEAKCWSATMINFYQYFNGVVAALTDYMLALLPIHFLRKLHLSRSTKYRIGSVLVLGFIPGTCAIVRCILTREQRGDGDILYSTVLLALFACIEQLMLLICASIAGCAPLFSSKTRQSRRVSQARNFWWSPLRTSRTSHVSDPGIVCRSWRSLHEMPNGASSCQESGMNPLPITS